MELKEASDIIKKYGLVIRYIPEFFTITFPYDEHITLKEEDTLFEKECVCGNERIKKKFVRSVKKNKNGGKFIYTKVWDTYSMVSFRTIDNKRLYFDSIEDLLKYVISEDNNE